VRQATDRIYEARAEALPGLLPLTRYCGNLPGGGAIERRKKAVRVDQKAASPARDSEPHRAYFCPIKPALPMAGAQMPLLRFVEYGNAQEYRDAFERTQDGGRA